VHQLPLFPYDHPQKSRNPNPPLIGNLTMEMRKLDRCKLNQQENTVDRKEKMMDREFFDREMVAGGLLPFELPQWIACAPFEEYLGMRIDSAEEGKATLTMPFLVKHAQGKGLMHGGALTALADTAVAMAIKSLLPEDSHFATTSLSLLFHAPVKGGTVRAEALITSRDDREITGEACIYDDGGVKVATFTSTFRVKRR
jgi:acyl-CoA thioesterase